MDEEISFIENDIFSLNLNLNKNNNCTPEYKKFLNENSFESCYDVERIIGGGGFAVVYCGTRKADRKQFAIKHIDKQKVTSWFCEEDGVNIPMEIILLIKCMDIDGVNVMVEYFEKNDSFIIILEKPEKCRDLFDEIIRQKCLDEEQARKFLVEIVQVLITLQDTGVFHNDIKDENILIDLETSKITLIDFGSGVMLEETDFDDTITDFEGTRVYSPPEWIEQGEMSLKSGCVWSIGVLLYSMTCGDVPYHSDAAILQNTLPDCQHLSDDCRDLIESCMQSEVELRLSLEQILQHPWIINH